MKNILCLKTFCHVIIVALIAMGCNSDFLEAKPDKSLLIPRELKDYQALLDNAYNIMNRTPYLGEVSSDDYTIRNNTIQSYAETEQNAYRWEKRIYSGLTSMDWEIPFKQIFYANVVLEGLDALSNRSEDIRIKELKGSALFYRAWALHQIVQHFASSYDKENANSVLGIPVRVKSDVTLPSQRGSLQETYQQILKDITEAIPLLNDGLEIATRPSKAAAYALMARVQLIMQDYDKAKLYADSTLVLNNQLLDYNGLDTLLTFPMPVLYLTNNRNPEVIFMSILIPNSFLGSSNNTLADSSLLASYESYDLRKALFYDLEGQYTGSYIGLKSLQFSGLAVDEIYLIRAEASARLFQNSEALKDLNTLLSKRWKSGYFKPIEVTNNKDLLRRILDERRKQLVGRGLRWGDLKRINSDPIFAKNLYRNINGKIYSLSPGDKRYILPIPDNEISVSGIEQNER